MKILLLPLLFAGLLHTSFAQSQMQTSITTREIGTDYRTNTPLVAKQYQFQLPVYNFFPPEPQQPLTVLLRKQQETSGLWKPKGELTVIDPISGQQKWGKKINFVGTSIRHVGDALLEQRGNKLSRLTLEDGQVKWKRKTFLMQPIPGHKVALCYDVEIGFENILGIDLTTGLSMWSRRIDGKMGWESTRVVNDTTVLIKAGGIHSVGIKNGLGWDINRVTHAKKTDMKRVGLALLTGAAGGAMGYMMIPTGDFSDYYLHLSSNILYDGNVFYFAAKEKLTCHSLDGKKLWEAPLNAKITTKSYLYQEGNTIYLINKGAGIKYGWLTSALGNPYVAAFDADSGEQLFFKEWDERKNFITDYLVEGNELFLLYQDKVDIHRFAPEGLTQKYVSRIDMDVKLKEFTPGFIFIKQDSSFSIPSRDKEHFHIFSENNDLYRFSNDFQSNEKIPRDLLYRSYHETDSYLFLGNERETYIVDKVSYQPVARLNATHKSIVSGQKLLYSKANKLLELDISVFGSPLFTGR